MTFDLDFQSAHRQTNKRTDGWSLPSALSPCFTKAMRFDESVGAFLMLRDRRLIIWGAWWRFLPDYFFFLASLRFLFLLSEPPVLFLSEPPVSFFLGDSSNRVFFYWSGDGARVNERKKIGGSFPREGPPFFFFFLIYSGPTQGSKLLIIR